MAKFLKIDTSAGVFQFGRLGKALKAIADNFGLLEPAVTTSAAANYQPVLGDQIINRTNAGAQTTTIPPNATVAFPIGTKLEVIPIGAGAHTLVAGGGVTLNHVAAKPLTTPQYGKATLVKISANVWNVNGDLA